MGNNLMCCEARDKGVDGGGPPAPIPLTKRVDISPRGWPAVAPVEEVQVPKFCESCACFSDPARAFLAPWFAKRKRLSDIGLSLDPLDGRGLNELYKERESIKARLEEVTKSKKQAIDGEANVATCSSCLTFCSKGKPEKKAIEETPVKFVGVCKNVQKTWNTFISGDMTEKERAFLADKASRMPRRPSTVRGSLQAYCQKYETLFDNLRQMETPNGWVPLKTQDGVEISTQSVQGEPFVYAKGVCVMKTHGKGLRHLVALMLTAKDRPLYDNLCESGVTVESYLPHYRVVHFRFRPPALAAALVYPRDCLMIGRLTADADGGQLLLLESTEHDDVPEKPDYVRMTAHVGYAFRPTDDPDAWKVTFAFCADLGGGVPTWVKNRVARDEPLVLAKFKAFYDKEYGPHKKMVHHSKSFTR